MIFESQILALFDNLPLIQNPKFNTLLWVSWFLGKNHSIFLTPVWKLDNPYCHTGELCLAQNFQEQQKASILWLYIGPLHVV